MANPSNTNPSRQPQPEQKSESLSSVTVESPPQTNKIEMSGWSWNSRSSMHQTEGVVGLMITPSKINMAPRNGGFEYVPFQLGAF